MRLVVPVIALFAAACGGPDELIPAVEPDATPPDAAPPDAAPTDETLTVDGWSATARVTSPSAGMVQASIELVRTEGEATRGGGVCLTTREGTACDVDADCPGAPDGGFTGGYIYCAAAAGETDKVCWVRPGSGLDYCYRNPANDPGTYTTPVVAATGPWMALGCMANADMAMGCAGTDPTQYVRVHSLVLDVE